MDDGSRRHRQRGRQRTTGGSHALTTEDIDWLVAHLRTVVASSPTVWAGRGMTLLQLTALHLISALAPVTLTDVAKALGTKPPATSAMVDRLIQAGLVCSTPDPQDRRRVHLTIATTATPIISNINQDTATRMQAMLNSMSPQNRRHLVDILRETVQQFAEDPGFRPPSVPL